MGYFATVQRLGTACPFPRCVDVSPRAPILLGGSLRHAEITPSPPRAAAGGQVAVGTPPSAAQASLLLPVCPQGRQMRKRGGHVQLAVSKGLCDETVNQMAAEFANMLGLRGAV